MPESSRWGNCRAYSWQSLMTGHVLQIARASFVRCLVAPRSRKNVVVSSPLQAAWFRHWVSFGVNVGAFGSW